MSNRTALSPDNKFQRMVALIIDAAFRCFEQNGARKTTMEDIARAAGITRPTVYAYFPNKMALAGAVMFDFSQSAYRAILASTDFAQPAGRVVADAQDALVRHFRSPKGVVLLSADDRDFWSTVARQVNATGKVIDELWKPLLLRIRDSGNLAQDLDLDLAATFLHHVSYSYLLHPDYASVQTELSVKIIGRALEP